MTKLICLAQPWATLVAMGVKTVLTYPYPTRYIGPLTIQADDTETVVADPYLIRVLTSGGHSLVSLPRGVVVAHCQLVACEKIKAATIPCYPEYAFSDFTPGWYAWKLAEIQAVAR